MKFNEKRDIDAPVAFVFAYLTDFSAWERSAMRRGADVVRLDSLSKLGPGMSWRATFPFRGKTRKVTMELTTINAPTTLQMTAQSPAIKADINLDLVEMSALRTRLHTVLEVTPRNLTARLFIQSLRLARARMDRKYAFRVGQLATDIEAAYQASMTG